MRREMERRGSDEGGVRGDALEYMALCHLLSIYVSRGAKRKVESGTHRRIGI